MNPNAFVSLLRESAATPDCPRSELFLADEWAALDAAEQTRIERHVETCAFCAAEREAARLFETPIAAHEAEEVAAVVARLTPPVPRVEQPSNVVRFPSERAQRPQPQRSRAAWALALAATVALSVGLFLQLRSNAVPELGLPPGEGDVVRGGEVALESPLGDLDAAPERLTFRAVAGADHYRISLLAVDGETLWSGEADSASIEIPADVRSRLLAAVSYSWKVEALDAAGTSLATSELARFRIRPSPEG